MPVAAPAEDDLQALAEDIKENGLLSPITLTEEGVLVDGRMRLKACGIAKVEPEWEFLNGQDPVAFIWSANGKRRQMTKGQMAMIAAQCFVAKQRGDEVKAAQRAGVSKARFSYAQAVKEHASHRVDAVINGLMTLDAAYKEALDLKRETDRRDNGTKLLEKLDPDLAQAVRDQEITIDMALATAAAKANPGKPLKRGKLEW
jgi:hypothetical protein